MRLVTWNAARGQFEKKAKWLDHLHADAAVIQEIAKPKELSKEIAWFGVNDKQGVAVVVRKPYSVKSLPEVPAAPKFFVPLKISGPTEFTLYAVWTLGQQEMKYVRAVTTALDLYAPKLSKEHSVVIGDFNSNAKWDNDHPANLNHTAMLSKMDSFQLQSAYHLHYKEEHGLETRNSFFQHRNKMKGHHIDYCFLPKSWIPRIREVDLGSWPMWHRASDHCPLLVEVNTEA